MAWTWSSRCKATSWPADGTGRRGLGASTCRRLVASRRVHKGAAIANLTPFRGVSADAGTAYEVGFMRALGKPVLAYSNTTRTLHARSLVYRAGLRLPFDFDAPGVAIEDFDLAENLMIEIAVQASGSHLVLTEVAPGAEMTDLRGFEHCIAEARRLLGIAT